MRIELNGQTVITAAASLAALLDEQGFDSASVATALDGRFVAKPMRAATTLCEGAKVEVLSPMQGG
jgi:sulfur carrier protein